MKTDLYYINGKEIPIPVAENYKDCITLIKSDIFRVRGEIVSCFSIMSTLLKPFTNTFLIWLRLASYRKGLLYPVCKFMYLRASRRWQIDIPLSTKIGYGLYIGHGMCMVINKGTIIGNNVNLSQFLNIGTNHNTPAIIGNNVYIGPSVCIVEDVKIENNSTVGAGSVVTRSIPENATAVGVPAKVINFNNPGGYICRKFEPK